MGGPQQPQIYSNTCPDPLKSYEASIQCYTIIRPPAKRPLNDISLAGKHQNKEKPLKRQRKLGLGAHLSR